MSCAVYVTSQSFPVWPKPPLPRLTFGKDIGPLPLDLFIPRNDKLGDPVSVINNKGFVAPVDQGYPDLSAVVAVYRSDTVHETDPMLDGKAASSSYLRLKTVRKFDRDAGRRSVLSFPEK